jgi:hypothetical protein
MPPADPPPPPPGTLPARNADRTAREAAPMDPYRKPPHPPAPAPARQDEGFEFELTDLEEARRVLDEESMSQFDVFTIGSQEEDQWKRMRRPKLPTDRALSGKAIDWLLALPANVRPQQLSTRFPRIANALAEIWDNPEERDAAVDKLLGDGRKGRKGFPPEVHHELIALREWMSALRGWHEPF